MSKLQEISQNLEILADFANQVFEEDGCEYSVVELYEYCKDNKSIVNFKVKDLIKEIFEAPEGSFDEPVGSKEFRKRAEKANLNYPIIVIHYNKWGNVVADGNHRVYKAHLLGKDNIKGFLLQEDELRSINCQK